MALTVKLQSAAHDPLVRSLGFDIGGEKMNFWKTFGVEDLRTFHGLLDLRARALGGFRVQDAHFARVDAQLNRRSARYLYFAGDDGGFDFMVVRERGEKTALGYMNFKGRMIDINGAAGGEATGTRCNRQGQKSQ